MSGHLDTAISVLRDRRDVIDIAIRALEAVRDGRDVGAAIGVPPSEAPPSQEGPTSRAEGLGLGDPAGRSADGASEPVAVLPVAEAVDGRCTWTPAESKALIRAYENGEPIDALAQRFNTTAAAINGVLRRARVDRARGGYGKWTVQKREQLQKAWNSGATLESMARIFSVTEQAICAQASAMGLSRSAERKNALKKKPEVIDGAPPAATIEPKEKEATVVVQCETVREADGSGAVLNPAATAVAPIDAKTWPLARRAAMAAPKVAPPAPEVMRPDEGPPRADTTVFARPVNGTPTPSRADKIREQMAKIAGAGAAIAADDVHHWPADKRASLTALWKAGRSFAEIAEAATDGGYPMQPRHVRDAVAQLGLTNDPDRRRAMHGVGGTA